VQKEFGDLEYARIFAAALKVRRRKSETGHDLE
jgi:hypothetical protein